MRKKLIGMAICAMLLVVNSSAQAGQKEFQKLTVGYTPIGAGSLPLFIAVEERTFQKYGYEVFPVFMGGSPLINSAILAGEFPIGYTGGGAVIASHLSGSDLVAIACRFLLLTAGQGRRSSRSVMSGERESVSLVSAHRLTSQRYRCWSPLG